MNTLLMPARMQVLPRTLPAMSITQILNQTPYRLARRGSTATKTGSEVPVLSSPKFSPLEDSSVY